MANQISTMLHLRVREGLTGGFWAVSDLAADQGEVEDAEDEVETGKADQCEDCTALADDLAGAVARAEQAVDEPRLAAQFGSHPADGVRDEREGKREHQGPEQRAR